MATEVTRRPIITTPSAVLLALIVLGGWYGLKTFAETHGDPIGASLVALEKQDRLTVFSAQLAPVVSADDLRAWGILQSRQIAVIPARVDFTIDLSKVDKNRLAWNAASQSLTVTLPPIEVSRPNLDEAHAQYFSEGVWITGEAQAKLTRDNTITAEKLAGDQAKSPVLIGLAREAARGAMRQNLAMPLKVAGYGKVRVEVKFDDEGKPG